MEISQAIGCILTMGALWINFTNIVKVASKVCNKKKRSFKARKYWVNPLNTTRKRREQGDHDNLIKEMRQFDVPRFVRNLRMTPETYDKLLKLVTPFIAKKGGVREALSPGLKLELTLR